MTAVFLMAGIALGDVLTIPVWPIFIAIAVLIAITLWLRHPQIQSLSIHGATLLLGLSLMLVAKEHTPVLPAGECTYEAVVASQPQVRGKVYRCDLWIMGRYGPVKVRASLLRSSQLDSDTLRVGDGLWARSVLENPDSLHPYHQTNFNYSRWLRVHDYAATVFVFQPWSRKQVSLSKLSRFDKVRLSAVLWRVRLVQQYARLGLRDRSLALLAAMTLGERSLIDHSQQEQFSVSGGSHVLALSGLHLIIIYTLLTLLVNYVGRSILSLTGGVGRDVVRLAGLVLTLVAVWCYVVLVGMGPSVVRAAAMISIYGMVSLLNRNHLSVNTLAFAAIVMLVAHPRTLWDVSFQLSFMAVLSIIAFTPNRRLPFGVSMLWVTVAAQIGTAPLVMYYFGRFSCYFLLTNCLVVPCTTCLLYGAVALWAATPMSAVQHAIATGLAWVAGLMDRGVAWIASLPGASIDNIWLSTTQVVAIYVLIFCTYRIFSIILHSK